MSNTTAFAACLLCAAAAFLILGFNYFALYQLLPTAVFYIFQRSALAKIKPSRTAPFVFYVLSLLLLLAFPLAAQLIWYFDVAGMASKSSTSGLLFVWLPIYATFPGTLSCSMAWISRRRSENAR